MMGEYSIQGGHLKLTVDLNVGRCDYIYQDIS